MALAPTPSVFPLASIPVRRRSRCVAGLEQGAVSILSSGWLHEFVHGARHLAGLPCH